MTAAERESKLRAEVKIIFLKGDNMSEQEIVGPENQPNKENPLSWEETVSQYPFMQGLSEEARRNWLLLSRDNQLAHIKSTEKDAEQAIYARNEWSNLDVPPIDLLPSEMLFRKIESLGCELQKSRVSKTGWQFRKRPQT